MWTNGSTDILHWYFKPMKASESKKNDITTATLSVAAKNWRPMVKQHLEVLKRQAAEVYANCRKEQFSLESDKKTGEQLKYIVIY